MGIPAISFLNPQVKEREARPVNNFFQTGQIPPISVSTGNEYGISIPKNNAYTYDVDGTKVGDVLVKKGYSIALSAADKTFFVNGS